eukprot:TRINITY_DN3669_c0_g1_i4.p1 TRINITY_DN3669_c0_g1~~TRINITY_DN3669_c0_g1_i4.p1  ORF type:complete len:694 (+),score=164.30 TRINITY_DN3669_c0_g1_i4:29-2110(+)
MQVPRQSSDSLDVYEMQEDGNSSESDSPPITPSTPISQRMREPRRSSKDHTIDNDLPEQDVHTTIALDDHTIDALHRHHYTTSKEGMRTHHQADQTSHPWDQRPWGSVSREEVNDPPPLPKKGLLDQFRATSIAGNDLLASVLYTIGTCTSQAGPLAPISLFLVCVFLYPFIKIYGEVGMALPLNGGSYNCLLNASSKMTAAIAGCLSLLSYTATCVVSAASATAYFNAEIVSIPVFWVTLAILFVFALLTLLGIRDSATVAAIIFFAHAVTLIVLIVASIIFMAKDGGQIFANNFRNFDYSTTVGSIYFGFCGGLLGITGFETSSNYIEEQKPGVFPKTMRNMWVLVVIFNPIVALTALGVVPYQEIIANSDHALSVVANAAGPGWLSIWMGVDAAVVLCGGVLTAYIGVCGLLERLAHDGCLPKFLGYKNKRFRSMHWSVVVFFVLCASLYAILDGVIASLGVVFALAFLSVMCMFAVGNLMLKYKRKRLPRTIVATWPAVLVGLVAMFCGLIGNFALNPQVAYWFIVYLAVPLLIVYFTMKRVRFAKMFHQLIEISPFRRYFASRLENRIDNTRKHKVAFFTSTDEIRVLNKAIKYSNGNEVCDVIKLIHVYEREEDIPAHLEENHYILDHVYPKLQIDLVLVKGKFGPELVRELSVRLSIPISFMFLACPGPNFPAPIGDFGGPRIILS